MIVDVIRVAHRPRLCGMRFAAPLFGLLLAAPAPALACGGFFCGNEPVDQQAERVVFAVGEDHTDMIVQIAYRGAASEFAWVLPLGFVPAPEALDTFSPLALNRLDAATAPIFVRPEGGECGAVLLNGGGSDADTPGVTVHLERVVGPYEVAVVEGDDAGELVTWLRDHGYRITDRMIPFVQTYVDEGMKLLALRLTTVAGVEDIEPFRLRMPTTTPSIPIRLTAIAAEPEMGILVFVLAERRYGPANWSELEIDPSTIRFESHAWPAETDYLARVAHAADELGGTAFVTEMAGPTAGLVELLQNTMPRDDDERRALRELTDLLAARPYMTRMYARLSPDEMTVDPMFSPHGGPDVPREVQLERFVDGEDMCLGGGLRACHYALCGNGECTDLRAEGFAYEIAGCECVGGTVARATFGPLGDVTVACVSPEGSLIGPGDEEGLGDPCETYDCGAGTCVPVNMTPTCDCDDGAVAIGYRETDGRRITRCVGPDEVITVPEPPRPRPPPAMDADAGTARDAGAPIGALSPGVTPGGGGCACDVGATGGGSAAWLLALAALWLRRR